MSARILLLGVVYLAFGFLTALALLDVGYYGIVEPHLKSLGGAQVFFDLVIMGLLVCVWMYYDAPERGLPAWPFIAMTIVLGSFGPLTYLIIREWRSRAA